MLYFPKWRYHATLPACIVNDPEAEAALGAGWYDSPTAAAEAVSAAVPASLDGISVAKAKALIEAADAAQIALWLEDEQTGAARASMIAALDARATELQS